MYKCRKCHIEISPTQHQIDKYDFICNACNSEYWRNYRNKRKELGNPINSVKMNNDYFASYRQKNRESIRKLTRLAQKRYRRDPSKRFKHEARWILNRAVRSGIVERKPCEICGEIKSEGHHSDYSKPIDVIWLCRKHHTEVHSKIKAKGL